MPKLKNPTGSDLENVVIEQTWIEVLVESNKDTVARNTESYLIPPRVADYIQLLEMKIGEDLPKLPIK